jgi:hypothetical protein
MVHAKDLRYGNKVFNKKGEIITVQQILGNAIVYDTAINVSRRHLSKVSGFYNSAYTTEVVEVVKEVELQEIVPIALTPKILEQCGFRNFIREEWIFTYGNNYHFDFEFTGEGLKLKHPTPTRIGIKYLHQLQNFIYAISGEELEFSL